MQRHEALRSTFALLRILSILICIRMISASSWVSLRVRQPESELFWIGSFSTNLLDKPGLL